MRWGSQARLEQGRTASPDRFEGSLKLRSVSESSSSCQAQSGPQFPHEQGGIMPTTEVRILVVGSHGSIPIVVPGRSSFRDWPLQIVGTLDEARAALSMMQGSLVLASENLPDGRGCEHSDLVARHLGSLLVCVSLSENSLRLPVIEHGKQVLGTRAIPEGAVDSEIAILLRNAPRDAVGAKGCVQPAVSKMQIPPMHKCAAEARAPLSAAASAGG